MAKRNIPGLKVVENKNYSWESNSITENGFTNEIITIMSQYPPDNSGDWVDNGWGNWTREKTFRVGQENYKIIPNGLVDDGWGNLTPIVPNDSLDSDTVKDVRRAVWRSNQNEDRSVAKVLNTILFKGQDFINLLISLNIVKNPSLKISYDNINIDILRDKYSKGYLNQKIILKETILPTNSSSNNLTFLGIDFSKNENVFSAIFIVILIYIIVKKP
jgi:hypothetical protein